VRVIIAAVLLSSMVPTVAVAQQRPPTGTGSKPPVQDARDSAKSTASLEMFGDGIRQQLLAEAEKRAINPGTSTKIDLTFRVTKQVPVKPVPSAENTPDACWEFCGGLHCYLACKAPNPLKAGKS
jgi:hypothetical protein